MTSIFQFVTTKAGKSYDAHHKTDGLLRRLDVTREDGQTGAVLAWGGGNAFKASVNMESFEEKSRTLLRRVASKRSYDVANGELTDAEPVNLPDDAPAAILFVSGTQTTGTQAHEVFAAAQAPGGSGLGSTSDAIPGATVQVLMQGRESDAIGLCCFFSEVRAMEDFLASELWQSTQAATPWENVAVEKYTVVDVNAAPSA